MLSSFWESFKTGFSGEMESFPLKQNNRKIQRNLKRKDISDGVNKLSDIQNWTGNSVLECSTFAMERKQWRPVATMS